MHAHAQRSITSHRGAGRVPSVRVHQRSNFASRLDFKHFTYEDRVRAIWDRKRSAAKDIALRVLEVRKTGRIGRPVSPLKPIFRGSLSGEDLRDFHMTAVQKIHAEILLPIQKRM